MKSMHYNVLKSKLILQLNILSCPAVACGRLRFSGVPRLDTDDWHSICHDNVAAAETD